MTLPILLLALAAAPLRGTDVLGNAPASAGPASADDRGAGALMPPGAAQAKTAPEAVRMEGERAFLRSLSEAQAGEAAQRVPPPLPAEVSQEPPEEFTGQSRTDLVKLYVSVRDENWNYYTPLNSLLQQEHFLIKESGKEQKLTHFWVEENPVSFGLVFDISGSMQQWYYSRIGQKRTNLEYAQAILTSFFQDRLRKDEYVLTMVRDQPEIIVRDFTQDISHIQSLVGFQKAEGKTALYETMKATLELFTKAHNPRRAMIVVTDGEDNMTSGKSKDALLKLAQEMEVQIFVVIVPGAERLYSFRCPNGNFGTVSDQYGAGIDDAEIRRVCGSNHRGQGGGGFPDSEDPGPSPGQGLPSLSGYSGVTLTYEGPRGLKEMENFTKYAGGWVFDARRHEQVHQALIAAYNQTRFKYILGYTPERVKKDGKWHKLEVRLRKPETAFPKDKFPEGAPFDLEVVHPSHRYAPKE